MALGRGDLGIWVLPIVIFGVGCRDLLAWSLGRWLGDTFLDAGRIRSMLGGARLDRARGLVRAHGARAVLVGRCLVGLRTPVFVVAGATGVPLRSFLVFDGIGLLIVVPVTLGLGFVFGEPIAVLAREVLEHLRLAIPVGLLGLGAGFVVRGWLRAAPRFRADDHPSSR